MINTPKSFTPFPLPLSGEMGKRIEQFDWNSTVLGEFSTWSSALQNIVSTMTASPFPMALLWGNDYVFLYNDGYVKTLGTEGKHPEILGKRFVDAFPETITQLKPLFDSVFFEAKSYKYEDLLVPIFRNRKLEDVYWTFSYSPVYESTGKVGGILVVCSETTEKIKKIIEKEEQFRTLANNSPDIIVRFDNNRKYIYASPAIENITGIPSELFIGKNYRELGLPEELCYFFDTHLDIVYHSKKPHSIEYYTPDRTVYLHTRIVPELDSAGQIQSLIIISTEITDRKKIEDELLYQKKLFESITENTDLSLFLMDERQYCIYMNEAAEKMTGYELDELKGKQLHYYIHHTHSDGRHYPLEECPMDQALPAHKRMKGEEIFVHKDGSFYPVAFTASPIYIDGRPIGTVIEVRETSEEKRRENELRESEKQFRNFSNNIQNLAWIAEGDGNIYWYNERWFSYTGTNLEEMRGWGWEKVHHPDHIVRVLSFVKAAWEKGDEWELTFPLRSKTGEYRWFLTRAYPIKDNNGKTIKWIGTNTDIHEQKELQKALEQSEQQLRLVADFMPQIVWATKADGYHNFYNKRWYEYTGHTVEQSKGEGWSNVLHPDDVERTTAVWKHSLQTGEYYQIEYRMKRADGEYRWLLARAIPFKNEIGEITRWFGTCTDIHEQRLAAELLEVKVKERTKELQDANNTLLNLNAELSQFNYITSHDLQEPLRKISVFTEQIEQSDYQQLSDHAKRNFRKVKEATMRMRNSLQDLLLYSTLDQQAVFEAVDLNKTLEGVLQDLEVLIQEKGARIHFGHLPVVKAIPIQMQQLFSNLINNSLKYSKQGLQPEISILAKTFDHLNPAASTMQLNKDESYVEIVVSDNGIGFSAEYEEKIFMLFQRLHNRSEYAGTGIGLSICKKVLLRHGGHIYAEGKQGEGARFHVILPIY